MSDKRINMEDFDKKCLDKIGLIKNLSEEEALDIEGNKTCIPYKVMGRKIIIGVVWYITSMRLVDEVQMQKTPPDMKFLVAKGSEVKGIEIGDILQINPDAKLHLIHYDKNSLRIRKQMELQRSSSVIQMANKSKKSPTTMIYCVEFFIVDAFALEAVELEGYDIQSKGEG